MSILRIIARLGARRSGVVALAVAYPLVISPVAHADKRAERGARAAVAPLAVTEAQCHTLAPGRHRVVCLLAHPAPSGHICRSAVEVRQSGAGRPIATSVLTSNVCMPLPIWSGA